MKLINWERKGNFKQAYCQINNLFVAHILLGSALHVQKYIFQTMKNGLIF